MHAPRHRPASLETVASGERASRRSPKPATRSLFSPPPTSVSPPDCRRAAYKTPSLHANPPVTRGHPGEIKNQPRSQCPLVVRRARGGRDVGGGGGGGREGAAAGGGGEHGRGGGAQGPGGPVPLGLRAALALPPRSRAPDPRPVRRALGPRGGRAAPAAAAAGGGRQDAQGLPPRVLGPQLTGVDAGRPALLVPL
ncbi:hypothetical protein PVAP13_1KG064477 [Panicum virgatum]|uniref:Uncharacterized protein n=1 Tax=Panicum virgatum TaxID=38727 RepID=A0A8T0XFK1_PANVG|nr:hypothetical protein PVAP13_1KG064477 [Panicum virgatum]